MKEMEGGEDEGKEGEKYTTYLSTFALCCHKVCLWLIFINNKHDKHSLLYCLFVCLFLIKKNKTLFKTVYMM